MESLHCSPILQDPAEVVRKKKLELSENFLCWSRAHELYQQRELTGPSENFAPREERSQCGSPDLGCCGRLWTPLLASSLSPVLAWVC